MLTRNQVTAASAGHAATYWGLEAPGVLTRLPPATAGVALTFDFCGGINGTGADLALLSVLRQQEIPATLFLNSRWITANQALAQDLAAGPLFELANHGTAHRPLSVTARSAYGIRGTRNPDEVSAAIVRSLGVVPVGFSINGDAGATFPAATVTREISRARAGDIVIAHGNHPAGGTAAGLTHALALMKDRGETFLPLPRTSST